MAFCTQCGAQFQDGLAFCPSCGAAQNPQPAPNPPAPVPTDAAMQPMQDMRQDQQFQQQYQQPQYQQPPYQQQYQQAYAAPVDNFDHTSEFDAKDISDNKVIAMLIYLAGVVGLFISFIAGTTNSPYASFHARQYLKILVLELLLVTIMSLLAWTIIVPIAGAVCYIILEVIKIIGFFQVCGGKAKEPAIVRGFTFLK